MFAGTNTIFVYSVSDLIKTKSMFIPRIMGLLFVCVIYMVKVHPILHTLWYRVVLGAFCPLET